MKEETKGINHPSIDKLLDVFDSKYKLAYAAAKRAKIIDQEDYSPISSTCDSDKSVGIALEEIVEGKVQVEFVENDQ